MDGRRAQDILRHILKDADKGVSMMEKLSIDDAIHVMTQILPACQKKASESGTENDIGFFSDIVSAYELIVADKIKNAEHLWFVYSEVTGYPYVVDSDLLVLYNFNEHTQIEKRLISKGYKVVCGIETPESFREEIAHMYRNGYENLRFIDGKNDAYVLPREAFYSYDELLKEDYMVNPGLQKSMMVFFQEFKKEGNPDDRDEILKIREDAMVTAILNAEYMVPCIKEESEEEVSISHPFVDLTNTLMSEDKDKQIIAIPAFTDGFELDKCYEGHHETMLYKFEELFELVGELDASGIVINPLGIGYYIDKDMLSQMRRRG